MGRKNHPPVPYPAFGTLLHANEGTNDENDKLGYSDAGWFALSQYQGKVLAFIDKVAPLHNSYYGDINIIISITNHALGDIGCYDVKFTLLMCDVIEFGSDSLLEVTPGPQDPILCVINLSQKLDNGQNDKNMSTAQYLSRIRNTKSNLTLA